MNLNNLPAIIEKWWNRDMMEGLWSLDLWSSEWFHASVLAVYLPEVYYCNWILCTFFNKPTLTLHSPTDHTPNTHQHVCSKRRSSISRPRASDWCSTKRSPRTARKWKGKHSFTDSHLICHMALSSWLAVPACRLIDSRIAFLRLLSYGLYCIIRDHYTDSTTDRRIKGQRCRQGWSDQRPIKQPRTYPEEERRRKHI